MHKPNDTDRIQKKIQLRATLDRVWRAISDSREFGAWFGLEVAGPFEAGKAMNAVIRPTKADAGIAAKQKEFDGFPFELVVDRIEPKRLFSFRWHPFAVEKGRDYSSEPHTLVTFELEEKNGGVLVTVTESGFDRIPLERRAKAFTANEQGWGMVVTLLEKYLGQA